MDSECDGLISALHDLHDSFNVLLPAILLRSNWQEMFHPTSWRNFKAIDISIPFLFLSFVDNMFITD